MVIGMIFGGLAFVIAGFVQLNVQSAQQTLKSGESKLILFNNAPFPLEYNIIGESSLKITNQTVDNGEVSS